MLCNRNGNLIWLHARKEGIGFYKKMTYQIKGMPFEIENIGEHIVMLKNL